MTPIEAHKRLVAFRISTEKAPITAVRRAMTRWRSLTIKDEQQHGIVRALLGRYSLTKFPPIVLKMKVQKVGLNYTGGLKLLGLSALQENGGRTRAHKIAGAFGRKGTATHPGGNVPAWPSADKVKPQVEEYLAAQLEREVNKAIAAAGLVP